MTSTPTFTDGQSQCPGCGAAVREVNADVKCSAVPLVVFNCGARITRSTESFAESLNCVRNQRGNLLSVLKRVQVAFDSGEQKDLFVDLEMLRQVEPLVKKAVAHKSPAHVGANNPHMMKALKELAKERKSKGIDNAMADSGMEEGRPTGNVQVPNQAGTAELREGAEEEPVLRQANRRAKSAAEDTAKSVGQHRPGRHPRGLDRTASGNNAAAGTPLKPFLLRQA